MATTSPTAVVEQDALTQPGTDRDAIPVGTPAWYAWLASSTSFAFRSDQGTFTAHKERRGPAQEYWKAYRRRDGRLHRAYLGKSEELTLDRLLAVASQLVGASASAMPRAAAVAQAAQDRAADAPEDGRGQSGAPADDTSAAADTAQAIHLLATKLALPPLRVNLVPRSRLVHQLDAAIGDGRRLILVSAPAGFGKTTLLAEWLSTAAVGGQRHDLAAAPPLHPVRQTLRPFKVAWLALDEADNHLGSFLAYLIAALETVRPAAGAEAWALLRTRAVDPPTSAILTVLVNGLADLADNIVLVLDDYHTITLQVIHEAVAFLLDRMPARLHIIISSRADPPLPLARLRVRGQLAEVRVADLRFTPAEAVSFFDQIHGVDLPSDAVTTLETRTEGWVAGLQLAALSLQQQDAAEIPAFISDFTGSHTYVFDYLAEEVFQRQPERVRTFLMQTAILARLCAPLCAAVTEQQDAQSMLEQLEQANLFLVRLDPHRRWYRYHHLFQDFVRERLERAVDAPGRALLHRRASAWLEQQELVGEAIDHALSAQAWPDAIRCLAPIMAEHRFYEYFLDWPRWLAALPDAALRADPDLCMRLARILILIGHVEAAERPLQLAEAVWLAADNQPKLGEVLSYRALTLSLKHDYARANQLAQQALAKLPDDAVEQRGIPAYVLGHSTFSLGQAGVAAHLLSSVHGALQATRDILLLLAVEVGMARAIQLQGQLKRAATLYQHVIQRAAGTHQQQPAVYFYLGRLYYEWNDLPAAEQALHEGIASGQRTGRGRFWPSAYAALAWVRWARGDVTQTTLMMDQALASARLLGGPANLAEAETRQAGLWLAQGDLAAALGWLAKRAIGVDDPAAYERQAEFLLLARIRTAQAREAPGTVDLAAVVRLLDRLLQMAEADGRMSDRITILALRALAYAANRDPDQALASLAVVLALAEPEGYIRTFVDEGTPMQSLLLAQRARLLDGELAARPRAYIDRLLAAFPPSTPAVPSTPVGSDLLSDRERAVLQLLAAGRTMQQIAELLIISANTVRAHVKHIYAKLDAHNRVEALERARGLRLL